MNDEGYNRRYTDCTTQDGHKYNGYYYKEDGRTFYIASDDNGNEYETDEQPVYTIDLTNADPTIYLETDNGPVPYGKVIGWVTH